MATENLLVNIEVDTKPAKRGVDDLNKALKENVKQTKAIQEELYRLEKDYKSIATAANKLPSKQMNQLASEVKRAEKATYKVQQQFERTTQKLERVHDRTVKTSEAFGVLAATMFALGRLDPMIRFTDQIVKASQAVMSFNGTIVPLVKETHRLLFTGLKEFPSAFKSLQNAIGLVNPMLREQIALFKGHQVVIVQTMRFVDELNGAFSLLSRAASHVNRALVGLKTFVTVTGEGITRVTRVFRTMGEALTNTGKIVKEFHSAWFGTFGASSGGAAQVNNFQKLLLNLQYYSEVVGKRVGVAFSKIGQVSSGVIKAVGPMLTTIRQAGPAFAGATVGALALAAGISQLPTVVVSAIAAIGSLVAMGASLNGFFNLFGPKSAGAAQVSYMQQLLINLQFYGELAAKRLRGAFEALPDIFKKGGAALRGFAFQATTMASALRGELASIFTGKTFSEMASSIKGLSLTSFSNMFSRLSIIMAETSTVARGFSVIMKDSFQLALKTALTTAIQLSSGMISLGQSVGILSKGLVGTIETGNLAGIGLIGLGILLKQTDIAFLDFIGTAVQFAGVFSLTVAGALTFVVGAIGRLAIAIGDTLINAMNQWELKFEKVQAITQAFQFTIQGFGKTIGEVATGSLGFWNEQVQMMAETTNFGAAEIQKSIKIFIAEGAQLGITAAQNAVLLKRAGDIAAVTGAELSHVSLAIARGMAGNSASLQDMGIFVDQATLQHSKYAESANLVVSSLTKENKAQLAMNVILDQTIPLVGAATAQLGTISGANKQYTQTVDTLLAKLGSQSSLFVKLTQVQTAFFEILNRLPTGLLDFISLSVDVAGVGLKLIGIFLTMLVTFASLKSAYEILNFTLKESTALQTGLNYVIGLAADRIKVKAIAVTSLGTLLKATSGVLLPALIIAIKSFQAAIISSSTALVVYTGHLLFTVAGWKLIMLSAAGATTAVLRFTASMLASPWTWVLGSIAATMVAVNDLTTQLKQFQTSVDQTNGSIAKTPGLMAQLAAAAKNILQIFVNVAKIVVIGWLQVYRVLELAAVGYQKVWAKITGNTKAFSALNKEGADIVANLRELGAAFDQVAPRWAGGTAHATEMANKLGAVSNAVKGVDEKFRGFSDTLKLSQEAAEEARIDVLGDEFDKANKKLREAKQLLGALRGTGLIQIGAEVVLPTTENLAKMFSGALDKDGKKATFAPAGGTDELAKAGIEAEKARLELVKLRRDGIKELQRALMTQEQLALEANNQAIEAIKLRGAEELRLINEKILGQQKIAPLLAKELDIVNKLKAAVEASTAAEVVKKQLELDEKRTDELKKQATELARIKGQIQRMNIEGLSGSNGIIEAGKLDLELQKSKIDELSRQASVQADMVDSAGQLKSEYQGAFDRARALAQEKFEDLVDSQKFSGQFEKAIEAVDPRNFAGKMAQEFLLGMNEIGQLGMDIFTGFQSAFAGVDFSQGFGAAFDKVMGNLNLTGVVDAFKGMDFSSIANIGSSLGNLGKAGKDMFKNVDWGKIGTSIGTFAGEMFIKGAALLGDLFDPEQINKLADFFGQFLQKLPDALGRAFQKLDGVLTKFVDAFPGLVTKILDALPGLVKSIMDKIPMIIDALVNGIVQLLDALPGIIQVILNALPGIFKKIMEALPTIITGIFEAIGTIIPMLIKAIPELLKIIIDGIPDIVLAFVEGFIAALGEIVAALVDFFIGGGLEKIIGAILRAIPKIVVALVKGIVNGLVRAFKSIFGGVKLPASVTSLPKKFTDGINNMGKKATDESSKLFKVLDLNAAARGIEGKPEKVDVTSVIENLEGAGMSLWEAFKKAVGDAWEWIKTVGKQIWDGLVGATKSSYEWTKKIAKALWDGFVALTSLSWEWTQKIAQALWDGFVTMTKLSYEWTLAIAQALWDGFVALTKLSYEWTVAIGKAIWDAVVATTMLSYEWTVAIGEKIWGALVSVASTAVEFVKSIGSLIWDGLVSATTKSYEWTKKIATKIWEGLSSAFTGAKDIFSKVGGFIWDGLKGLLKLPDIKWPTLPKFSWPELPSFSWPDFPKPSWWKLATGGPVLPFYAATGAMVPSGTDTVPAMLTPGEFVIKRSSVQALGMDAMKLINQGILPMSPQIMAAMGNLSSAISGITSAQRFQNGGFVGGDSMISRQSVQSLGGNLRSMGSQGSLNQEFNFEISMDVRADGLPDEAFIRQRLIPAMKKELKDSSLRGEFLISDKGLRKT